MTRAPDERVAAPGPRRTLLVLDAASADPEEVREALSSLTGEGRRLTVATEGGALPPADAAGWRPRVDVALDEARPEDYDLAVVVGNVAAMTRLMRHPVVARILESLQASQWDRRVKSALLTVSRAAWHASSEDAFADAVAEACHALLPGAAACRLVVRNAPGAPGAAEADASRMTRALRERRVLREEADGASLLVAPVITGDGTPLGALVVTGAQPFDADDAERVDLLATETADALHRRRLGERVEELARERGVALARLKAAHRELEEFAYSTSHDLAEPLRGIITLTAYLREDLGKRIPEEDEEMLARVHAAAENLKSMVNGLLEVTRAMRRLPAAGEEKRVAVGEVAADVAASLGPSLRARNARVIVRGDLPVVSADRVAIEQILLNLISNALRHNDKAEPLVEVGCEDTGQEWAFHVTDNGPGIPEEYLDRVFRVYGRVPGREAEGTGIGLALVRKLVDRLGGRVWVESPPGKGATFRFTLGKT